MTSSLVTVAREHLGEPGPNNSCLEAVNRWVDEAGGKPLPTASVSAAVQLVQGAGRNGWTYHEGLNGVQVGDVLRWQRAALGPTREDPNPEHVSVYTARDGHGNMQSIGSGGPSGRVALQPQSGGFNPPSTFRGYFRVQLEQPAPAKPPAKPAASSSSSSKADIVVAKGDTLTGIAARERTSVQALLRANPKATDGRTRNYHITRPNLILVGQRLHRP